ncbi:hypothetical protein MmiHf6_12370 [Methanimicrococcus hongohii]|uniref:Uncharacterized protein n=1 Tax=Methanimicrococcus hongohii TaxID=3028295 RepID=A0AA96ZSW3_9EURY|nr:hypothetical protein MmiHf6_12370 [Methanimicrococcus sp. Hf6]
MQTLNERNIISFVECCILSFPLILFSFLFASQIIPQLVRFLGGENVNWWAIDSLSFTDCVTFIFIFILNYILYCILKKKYNFEIYVFLYGVGFTSCCVTLVILIQTFFIKYAEIGLLLWCIFYMLSFMPVYYSYAILYQDEKKETDSVLSRLPLTIFVFSLISTVVEIINSRPPVAGVLLLLFGLYVNYFIFKKFRLSLRGFAWSMFLPMVIVFCYRILTTPFL